MDIILKILVVFIIYFVIKYISLLIEKKTKENKRKQLIKGVESYVISYNKGLKLFSISAMFISTIVWLLFMCQFLWGVEISMEIDVVVIIATTLFQVITTILFSVIYVWRIEVKQDTIFYRNYIGKIRKYNFKDIKIGVESGSDIVAYEKGKKIFSIGPFVTNASLFLRSYANIKKNRT